MNQFHKYLVDDKSNAFVFLNPEPLTINILQRWSGICDQFGLSSFMSSFKT